MNANPPNPPDPQGLSELSAPTRALLEEYRAERRRRDEEDAAIEESLDIPVSGPPPCYCGPPPAMFSRGRVSCRLIRFRLPAGDVERTDCVRNIPEHLREASFAELLDHLIADERADHAREPLVYLLDKVLSGNFHEVKGDNEVTIW
jgi:hypothetical protein